MDEKTFVGGLFGIVALLVFITLAVRSGLLPLAVTGGVLVSGAAFCILREWRIALAAGGVVALTISTIGVGIMLSGG